MGVKMLLKWGKGNCLRFFMYLYSRIEHSNIESGGTVRFYCTNGVQMAVALGTSDWKPY